MYRAIEKLDPASAQHNSPCLPGYFMNDGGGIYQENITAVRMA